MSTTTNLKIPDWTEEKWKSVFRSVLDHTVLADEKVEDFIAGGWALGERRSNLFMRDLVISVDVTLGLSIFCLIPFKPPVRPENYDYLTQNRWRLFAGSANDTNLERRFADVVPDRLLKLDQHQLAGLLQTARISEILQIEEPDTDEAGVSAAY